MTTRYGATRAEYETLLTDLGQPRYRAQQVFDGLFAQGRPLESLTNVPRALRAQLDEAMPLAFEVDAEQHADRGTTTKWLWRAGDGEQVETVLMEYTSRATVCVSSQAGCAMGCTFCATGQAGFRRHLDVGEIVEQVLRAQHGTEQRVSNVVFMGMGEPLANVDPVLEACRRLHDDVGISARHIVVSTVGVVPGMQRLTDFELPVTLAVSLHSADDTRREKMVPLNRRYPIEEVLGAAREYADRKGRRVTFEYACIDGVNDSVTDAQQLGRRLKGLRGGAHVNLIPLNATSGYSGRASARLRIEAFAERLREQGINVSIRRNRGTDIDAACGQLRSRHQAVH
ncbi:MAG TPA: 23S rRNA (adenine(2503)-C(2))-methyltransferase RlmN [Acidimicrobiia bacterium]|jgi:23S rRNA (adenine2503-C2)-methyltransferase|nr:23S rRNA (adenine(2503)-C(2))-methyltransferase RlmN [Acidimicrobiia bacterium]